MKSRRNIKGDLPFLLVLFVLLFLIPHIAMSIPGFPGEPLEDWGARVGEGVGAVIWFMFWSVVPLLAMATAVFHVLYDRSFSLLLPLEALLISFTFLFRLRPWLVLGLAVFSLFLLAVEGFNALGEYARRSDKKPGLLAEAASNYKFLALVFFWSAGYAGAFQVTCHLCVPVKIVLGNPLAMVLPTVVLFFLPLTALDDPPLTGGGALGLLLCLALTLVLDATLYMGEYAPFRLFFLRCTLLGFALLFLMEGIIRLRRRVKARGRPSGS